MDVSKMDVSALDERAEAAAELLKSLANPVRLKILCSLVDGECSVGTLAGRIGVRETVISQHLMRLRAEGLVSNRRERTTVYYRLNEGPALGVMRALYEAFCSPLAAPLPVPAETTTVGAAASPTAGGSGRRVRVAGAARAASRR